MLTAKNLRLKYPNTDHKIFDGLDINIKTGEKVLLLGPSGSGKSTLLNVLSGIVPDLIELPMKYDQLEIDTHSGVIFQDPDSQFCMPKVHEELAFILENQQVPRAEMDAKISSALKAVDLHVNPHQFISQLSGGMKQKLAIAETLLQNAQTLFLDEPTAMLDESATQELWTKIKALWQDKTVLIVEHKVAHIWEHIDRVLLFNYEGKIIADAPPQMMLQQYEDLLTEYGVWHPNAWSHAPKAILSNNDTVQQELFTFINGEIKRGAKTLITIDKMSIKPSEFITITGPNGSGKTSLLESIMQLIKYHGDMYINDKRIKKIKNMAQYSYLVYQNPELQFITNSVYDEVLLQFNKSDNANAKRKTKELLQTLSLEHVMTQHPYELSMGQKRRLSVATALSAEADIILLDEPTFGLDSHNTFNLISLFQQRVTEGQTVIMVTHDAEIINRYATRRLHIEQQQLIELSGETHV
ncbi:ABC transporter ATP-binding protein [Staphylococcus arlettae]|uniref:ABC transporter ATP-binding protein n=2 Tax=Staphylococcus arlettae TaxID=29378 RepID=A0A380CIQ4_9STAP|nr:ABC transporter ATP-binding protein [Staphylococcus arlettae]MCE4986196.1 ABC transporter ATP-binding protein [Staphylococcus arlettae]MEB5898124.1 energy-coupling factor ABC transporter ATP-binding protein [Staphylococcus arlettae]NKE84691.1 ABC transporter ATP-binding protein [Staphylococcus arlettae]PNZ55253.1 ABC transporter ATP-binding protein [Staphylococcus arlettae]URN38448.1 energy-coupling factor ABC transporter ATP-binding protein [Staphylococcus arlettae]